MEITENTTEEELVQLLNEMERVCKESIKTKKDLEIFSDLYEYGFHGWRYNHNDREKDLYSTLRYIESNRSYGENSLNINLSDYTTLQKFMKYNGVPIEFFAGIEYIDEKLYSFYEHMSWRDNFYESISPSILEQMIHYQIKVRKSKEAFKDLLKKGFLKASMIKEYKLTNKQFVEFIFSYFKELTKRRVKLKDIRKLKILRKIKDCFTEEIITELVTRFIKEAEVGKMEPETIEVVLGMFFYYLGLDIEDYPDAGLLLAIQLTEVEI